MRELFKVNTLLFLVLIFLRLVVTIPTSVLANSKEGKIISKVKRSSPTASNEKLEQHQSGANLILPFRDQQIFGNDMSKSSSIKKRGINSQLIYDDILAFDPISPKISNKFNSPERLSDDFSQEYYRQKSPQDISEIDEDELLSEPMVLPLQYSDRLYENRWDGGINENWGHDPRLKRDSKLSTADMLALVALVEAGERARREEEIEEAERKYRNFYNSRNEQDDLENVSPGPQDYYDIIPYNFNGMRYSSNKDLNTNPLKRIMMAKKKRSLEEISKPEFRKENFLHQDYSAVPRIPILSRQHKH